MRFKLLNYKVDVIYVKIEKRLESPKNGLLKHFPSKKYKNNRLLETYYLILLISLANAIIPKITPAINANEPADSKACNIRLTNLLSL